MVFFLNKCYHSERYTIERVIRSRFTNFHSLKVLYKEFSSLGPQTSYERELNGVLGHTHINKNFLGL